MIAHMFAHVHINNGKLMDLDSHVLSLLASGAHVHQDMDQNMP